MWWRILGWLYNIIRPIVVPDCYADEDYSCMHCDKPVLTRVLYCSTRCSDADDLKSITSLYEHSKKKIEDLLFAIDNYALIHNESGWKNPTQEYLKAIESLRYIVRHRVDPTVKLQ